MDPSTIVPWKKDIFLESYYMTSVLGRLVTLVKSKLHHKINAFQLTITQWLTTMFNRYVTFILKSRKRSGNYDVFTYGGAKHLY
jgi:hypothetical protein